MTVSLFVIVAILNFKIKKKKKDIIFLTIDSIRNATLAKENIQLKLLLSTFGFACKPHYRGFIGQVLGLLITKFINITQYDALTHTT